MSSGEELSCLVSGDRDQIRLTLLLKWHDRCIDHMKQQRGVSLAIGQLGARESRCRGSPLLKSKTESETVVEVTTHDSEWWEA